MATAREYVHTRMSMKVANLHAPRTAPNIGGQRLGGDLIRRFETHLPLVGHVQVAAVPSRRENQGEVNYPEIFAALDRLGYAGHVGCEYRPRGRTEEGLGWAWPYGIVPRG
jgi:hydroxypyruvate isomerase